MVAASAISDPFGHLRTIATHIKDVLREEIDKHFTETADDDSQHDLKRSAAVFADMWKHLRRSFSRWHAWIALALCAVFSVFNFLIVSSGLDQGASDRWLTVALTTAGTILGPMPGAISRDFQGCCLEFSLSLYPFAGGALALALVVQAILPAGRAWWLSSIRLLAWAAGLFIWFGSGVVSFAHALS